MVLESGPAKAERNWQLLRTVLFLGFAAWFVYDGAVRWPAQNRREAEQQLAAPEPFGGRLQYADLGEPPTKQEYQRVVDAKPTKVEQVHELLGKPQYVRTEGAGRAVEFFVGQYGYVAVPVDNGRVNAASIVFKPWKRDKSVVRQQYYWAIVPLIPGLYFLWRTYKAATLRVTIDDEGMVYDGQRIAFADMVSLRDYSPKGWIDLYYRVGEREKRLRLDNEKVLRFDEIVDALCKAKGFRNEVREYAEEKARQKAEEAAAAAAEDAERKDAGGNPT